MYGDMQSSDADENKKRITYSTKTIDVARCADCKKKHGQAKLYNAFCIIMLAVMLAGAILAVTSAVEGWIWGLALGLSLGLFFLFIVSKGFTLKGINNKSAAKKEYPEVEGFLARGYKFGKNPSYDESVKTNGAVS